MKNKKVVIPISGGMDSTVLLHYGAINYDEVYAISFNYGQRHVKELACAESQVKSIKNVTSFKQINIPFFKDIAATSALTNNKIDVAKAKDVMGDPQTVNYVPFRNMMLLSIACAYAEAVGAEAVYHGAAQADSVAGFWDGSPEFLESINHICQLNRRNRVNILAPLINKSKKEIIEMGLELGVDFGNTWTCYEGMDKACGECTACALRLKGFIDSGNKDPLVYSKHIPWEKYIS